MNGNRVGFFQKVYGIVKSIPMGEVMTYGQVARILGTRDARRVGQALHANKDKNVPCHRVIFANGSLAPNYAFGGAEEQKKKLLEEGVRFEGDKVDLKSLH